MSLDVFKILFSTCHLCNKDIHWFVIIIFFKTYYQPEYIKIVYTYSDSDSFLFTDCIKTHLQPSVISINFQGLCPRSPPRGPRWKLHKKGRRRKRGRDRGLWDGSTRMVEDFSGIGPPNILIRTWLIHIKILTSFVCLYINLFFNEDNLMKKTIKHNFIKKKYLSNQI